MSSSNWNNDAISGDWNNADNWSGTEVPTDIATFDTTSNTAVTFSATEATVSNIHFSADSATNTFTFTSSDATPALTISGNGVTNDSGKTQYFTVASIGHEYWKPQLKFTNNAKAGTSSLCYSAGPEKPDGYGGGIIGFCDYASAQEASFTVTTGSGTPPSGSTVGAEISFSDHSTADKAHFTLFGSTSKTDGDTFGNVVFHDEATAAQGTFTNIGGTVSGGDGGNTQFYNSSTAGTAVFNNKGGTFDNANGGDVAFDGTANGANGSYYNHPGTVKGAHGGVTSFNNNPPKMDDQGASAGYGNYHNYGASVSGAGGGHTEFTGKYGTPTGDHAKIYNFGGTVAGAYGGYTSFGNSASAGNAFILATGKENEGSGGKIAFYDQSSGGNASIHIEGTGILELSDHTGAVTVGKLTVDGGIIHTQLGAGNKLTTLWVEGDITLLSDKVTFSFWGSDETGFSTDTDYTILGAANLARFSAAQFTGNPVNGHSPSFSFDGDNNLQVRFST